MKVIVVFKRLLASDNDQHGRHPFKWGKPELRYLVYLRYLWLYLNG